MECDCQYGQWWKLAQRESIERNCAWKHHGDTGIESCRRHISRNGDNPVAARFAEHAHSECVAHGNGICAGEFGSESNQLEFQRAERCRESCEPSIANRNYGSRFAELDCDIRRDLDHRDAGIGDNVSSCLRQRASLS